MDEREFIDLIEAPANRGPLLCKECHHRPSERIEEGYVARCYCSCHDVADASPDLLAACEQVLKDFGDRLTGKTVIMLRDAIAKASPQGQKGDER
jgi:hypothetical protein